MGEKTYQWSALETKQWPDQICIKNIQAKFFTFQKRGLLHLAWYRIVTNDP